MRHRRHNSKLNRTVEHRTALMRNLAIALFENGVIKTTEPKAKQLRQYAERLITIAKDGVAANDDAGVGLAKRRLAFKSLNNKEAVKKLFADIAPAAANRVGGYTRVVKAGPRAGDGAPMAYIELVDRQVDAPEAPAAEAKATKPRRRTKKATGETAAA